MSLLTYKFQNPAKSFKSSDASLLPQIFTRLILSHYVSFNWETFLITYLK